MSKTKGHYVVAVYGVNHPVRGAVAFNALSLEEAEAKLHDFVVRHWEEYTQSMFVPGERLALIAEYFRLVPQQSCQLLVPEGYWQEEGVTGNEYTRLG
jgi:hypothetical protein